MSSDCIFCQIAARELPAGIVYEDEEILAFDDIGPQAPTHVLIIPKMHIATLNELTEAHADLIGRLALRAREIAAERGLSDSGFRLVLNCNENGGQTVFHIHMHLLGGHRLGKMG